MLIERVIRTVAVFASAMIVVSSPMEAVADSVVPVNFGDINITNKMYTAEQVDQMIGGGSSGDWQFVTNTYTIATNALTRQEAEAGFTEWVCSPATVNGKKIKILFDDEVNGWYPSVGIDSGGEAKGDENSTNLTWESSHWSEAVELTATRTRLPTMADLDGKASTNDVKLTPVYSQTPTFSEWTCNPATSAGSPITIVENPAGKFTPYRNGVPCGEPKTLSDSVTSIKWIGISEWGDDDSPDLTATRTRTDIIGYTLGTQTNSVLVATNGILTATSVSNIVEDMISPLQLAKWYPDGSVTNVSQFTQGINYTFDTNSMTAAVNTFQNTTNPVIATANSHLVGSVIIPPYVVTNGIRYKVVETLDSSSYYVENYNITSVTVPTTVERVGKKTFCGCASLFSVSLPRVKDIGDSAFEDCYSLISVFAPNATTVGADSFNLCMSLQSISLPVVTNIEGYAFGNCYALKSIDLPNVVLVGHDAFNACTNLHELYLPSATRLGTYAFSECDSLSSLDFGSSARSGMYITPTQLLGVPETCSISVPDENYTEWVESWGPQGRNHRIFRHSEWEYARRYELEGYVLKSAFTNDVCNIVTNEVSELTEWAFAGDLDATATYYVDMEVYEINGLWGSRAFIWGSTPMHSEKYRVSNIIIENVTHEVAIQAAENTMEVSGTIRDMYGDVDVGFMTATRRRITSNALGLARLIDLPPLTNNVVHYVLDKETNNTAVTIGTRKANTPVGVSSLTVGRNNEAQGAYTIVQGANSRATGNYSLAVGRNSVAGTSSFVWNSADTTYTGPASYSFSINPLNGEYGVYIGTNSLVEVVQKIIDTRTTVVVTNEMERDTQPVVVTNQPCRIYSTIEKWVYASSYFTWDVGNNMSYFNVVSNGVSISTAVTNINIKLPKYELLMYDILDNLYPNWYEE